MQVFLKLPKEILSLIFSHIKDQSIIESLILIPELQHIPLEQKYPKFEITNNIETIIGLFQKYNFTPSIIIGDINQIKKLIDEPAFRSVNYEVKILQTTKFSDFVSILEKVYVTGIHFDVPSVGLLEKEINSFLDYVGSNNLQSLTISHLSMFKVQFPKSLKHITLNGGQNFELDLSGLQYLESLDCKDLLQINSLENLKLPSSIKNLRLDSCDFESLGNLIKYDKLNLLQISNCPEIYNIIHTRFPDSLKTLDFINNFQPDKIAELGGHLHAHVSNNDSIRIVCHFFFPPNLKKLRICDTTQTLRIGTLNIPNSLTCLELENIGEIDLEDVLLSLPKKMSEIIIRGCQFVYSDNDVLFPESKSIKFTNNRICFEIFKTNLNQLKELKELDMSDNTFSDCGKCKTILDPFLILTKTMEKICFETPELQSLILKSSVSMFDREYDDECGPPSEVSFNCKNLTKVKMINLNVSKLDLTEFPSSLEELTIQNLILQTIDGNFSKFNKLKILDLQNNEISFSMLSSQKFPSSLTNLNLSDNILEDLSCLKLDSCVDLHNLTLKKITADDEPEGAMQLIDLLLNLNTKVNAILTNYESKVIFKIVDGVKEKSNRKRRKIN
ncbi:uncharacterized protein KGF55_003453 [Candida pseudojiufengensis]|uniref:uncharacterized protein n=1 Tax=Candida pseudojiufengensis TaxID=497109 RepID=UPI0022251556|nr:uncharacterized protein KGF55_003453 [Candida pseudojiufengensis]KAI5962377.1 hypothetical protein KGF55_003453 [Candida pseudojiufengensis]